MNPCTQEGVLGVLIKTPEGLLAIRNVLEALYIAFRLMNRREMFSECLIRDNQHTDRGVCKQRTNQCTQCITVEALRGNHASAQTTVESIVFIRSVVFLKILLYKDYKG